MVEQVIVSRKQAALIKDKLEIRVTTADRNSPERFAIRMNAAKSSKKIVIVVEN